MTRLHPQVVARICGAALLSVAVMTPAGCTLGTEGNSAADAAATPEVTENAAPTFVTPDDPEAAATQTEGGGSGTETANADVVVVLHDPGALSRTPAGSITLVDEQGNRLASDAQVTWWAQFGNLPPGQDVGVATFSLSQPSDDQVFLAAVGPDDHVEVIEGTGFSLPAVDRELPPGEVLTRQSEPESIVIVDFSVNVDVQAMNRAQARDFVRSATGQI